MPFTFSHDTKSTVKLKITITTKFKSNRSSTGYIKEAGRWKTPTFPCAFFHKITSLFIADTSLINHVNTIPPSYTLLTKTVQIVPTMHNYQHHPQVMGCFPVFSICPLCLINHWQIKGRGARDARSLQLAPPLGNFGSATVNRACSGS